MRLPRRILSRQMWCAVFSSEDWAWLRDIYLGTVKWRECRERRKDFWIDPEYVITVITYLQSVVVTSSLGRKAQGTFPDLQNGGKVSLGWKQTFVNLVESFL